MNKTGRIYDADIDDTLQKQEQLWQMMNAILTRLAAIK